MRDEAFSRSPSSSAEKAERGMLCTLYCGTEGDDHGRLGGAGNAITWI